MEKMDRSAEDIIKEESGKSEGSFKESETTQALSLSVDRGNGTESPGIQKCAFDFFFFLCVRYLILIFYF